MMRNLKLVRNGFVALLCATIFGACGMFDSWDKMSIDGVSCTFEMPKPVKMIESAKDGMVLYCGQKEKEKLSFKVAIVHRNYEEDQKKGMTDEAVLTNFAKSILQQSQQQFAQMGMQTKFDFNGSFPVEGGLGQQYQGNVGKAIVLNRFYINKVGLYWVEAIAQDPQNADINRFLSSFKP